MYHLLKYELCRYRYILTLVDLQLIEVLLTNHGVDKNNGAVIHICSPGHPVPHYLRGLNSAAGCAQPWHASALFGDQPIYATAGLSGRLKLVITLSHHISLTVLRALDLLSGCASICGAEIVSLTLRL